MEVEVGEPFLVVDVQPPTAGVPGTVDGSPDQLLTDPSAPKPGADEGIQHESMICAVPSDVHEADKEIVVLVRRHPAEAVRFHRPAPVAAQTRITEGFPVETGKLRGDERSAPDKADHD